MVTRELRVSHLLLLQPVIQQDRPARLSSGAATTPAKVLRPEILNSAMK